jgi:hypothetical protein
MHHAMPQPGDEHRRLHAMAGSWVSQETLHPSPWDPVGGTATGRAEARVALDGFVVVTDYEQERGGRPGYRGHGVFGFDAGQGRPFMQWSDNMSPIAANTVWGAWEGSVLTFQMQGPNGHHRYVYKFDGPDAYVFELGMSPDGKTWNTFMDGRFSRKR